MNSINDKQQLFVTHLDHIGPYLKVFGQLNRAAVGVIHARTTQILPTCFLVEPDWPISRQQAILQPGLFCLYKHTHSAAASDSDFLRVRVLNSKIDINEEQDKQILKTTVELIDFGNTLTVHCHELIVPKQPQLLSCMPIMCSQFILHGICYEWTKNDINAVLRLILNETVEIVVLHEVCNQQLIKMTYKEFDFAEYLIQQKKIGVPIETQLLLEHLAKTIRASPQMAAPSAQASNEVFYNNFCPISEKGVKSATDLAREQLAARRSLSARLERFRNFTAMVPTQPVAIRNTTTDFVVPVYHYPSLNNYQTMPIGRESVQFSPRLPFTEFNYQVTTSNNFIEAKFVAPVDYTRFRKPNTPYGRSNPSTRNYFAHRPPPPQKVISTKKRPSYKVANLNIGQTCEVTVSFVENGPYCFSVHLRGFDGPLMAMMERLEKSTLYPLYESPVIGMACIARYSEDNHLYRALVTSIVGFNYRVHYVDYGNSEVVTLDRIFTITEEFLEDKPYSMRFMMSGTKQLEPIDDSMKKTFKNIVLYNNFKMTVMPLEGPPVVQFCKLSRNGTDVLDEMLELKRFRLAYPKAEPLKSGDLVEIRYIVSPKKFYVQKAKNIAKFQELMDDLFVYYNKNQVVPETLQLGLPCITRFENEWFRGEIIRNDEQAVMVRHVDFGYEQRVTANLLCNIAPQHLKMPRQAVQCCLKGFENNEITKLVATDQFEMLAEESNLSKRRQFNVKIFKVQPDGLHIVNLCSETLNVMKKLYKLSMPYEQYLSLERNEFKGSNRNTNGKESSIETSDYRPAYRRTYPNLEAQRKERVNREIRNLSLARLRENQASKQNEKPSAVQETVKNQPKQCNKQTQKNFDETSPSSTDSIIDVRSIGSGKSNNSGESNNSSQNKAGQHHNSKQIPQHLQNGNHGAIKDSRSKQQSPKPQETQQSNPQVQREQDVTSQQEVQKPLKQKPSSNSMSPKKSSVYSPVKAKNDARTIEYSYDKQSREPPEHYVSLTDHTAYHTKDLEVPMGTDAVVSCFNSPFNFYVNIINYMGPYDNMMQNIQNFYENKPTKQLQLKTGSNIIARCSQSKLIMRGRITACNQSLRKYKVLFIDTGVEEAVMADNIWQLEKRFTKQACFAYRCSLIGIVGNCDYANIIKHLDEILPKDAKIHCQFMYLLGDKYIVDVSVNGILLKEALLKMKYVIPAPSDVYVSLLKEQQLRATFVEITSMTNFKLNLVDWPEELQIMATFDDLRFVKANPDIAETFKTFYVGKSCVFNIKTVDDNQIVHLRPIMPLFKEDIPSLICTYPVLSVRFSAIVVHVASATRFFVQPSAVEDIVSTLITEMYTYYEDEKKGVPLDNYEQDQICAVLSHDTNWYRARVISSTKDEAEIYFLDFGNKEHVPKNNLRKLAKIFYVNKCAYCIEINLPVGALSDEETVQDKLETLSAITIEPIEVCKNHLIADVKLDKQVCLLSHLQLSRNVEFAREKLKKDKSNLLVYVETVDLTLDDEIEAQKIAKKTTDSVQKITKRAIDSAPQPVATKTTTEKPATTEPTTEKPVEPAPEIVVSKAIGAEKIDKEPGDSVEQVVAKTSTEVEVGQEKVSSTEQKTTPETEEANLSKAGDESQEEADLDPYPGMATAILSHCDNPAQFYIHTHDRFGELLKLQENLQIVAPSLPPLPQVANGVQCISLYSVDKQWYRAKIIDAELMVLQFIDFGNTDCVSDASDLKESMWPHVPPYCIPVALPISPNGTVDWVDAANIIFNESYCKVLRFEFITRGNYQKKSFINLIIDNINVTEKLIADGYAKPLQVVTNGEKCFISHINSISDFCVQFEKDSKALDLIELYLEKEELKPLKEFKKSAIVAAIFSDDGLWYRAELLREIPGEGYEVIFIDYGNKGVTKECRLVSEEIAKLPALSQKCELELPSKCSSWTDEAEDKFGKIAAGGETVFTIELSQPAADRAIVNLFIDDENIIEHLLSMCIKKKISADDDTTESQSNKFEVESKYEKGVVSQVNSPIDFYVMFDKDLKKVQHIIETLSTQDLKPLPKPYIKDQLCAARFDKDKSMHRARILSWSNTEPNQFKLFFIDYGKVADVSEVFALPLELLDLNPLVKHCQIPISEKLIHAPQNATETFEALLGSCKYKVMLEFIDRDTNPSTVTIYSEKMQNISKKLNDLLDNAINGVHSHEIDDNHCVITHADSPKCFYVHLTKNASKISYLVDSLSREKFKNRTKINPLDVKENMKAICYIENDDGYFRCVVKQIIQDTKSYKVFLVDFGNEVICKELYEVPQALLKLPALSTRCCLYKIPDNVCDKELNEAFVSVVEHHFGEKFEIKEFGKLEHPTILVVQLLIDHKDLAEELGEVLSGSQQPAQTIFHDCNIVQYNSAQSFYLQLDKDSKALQEITDNLNVAIEKLIEKTELKCGDICAALFPDDGAYYRAEILKVLEDNKCEVLFIDFGNTAVTDKFRKLSDHMCSLKRFSYHCKLDNASLAKYNCAKLQAFIDMRFSETFQVEFLDSKSDPIVVRLFYKGVNLADECAQE